MQVDLHFKITTQGNLPLQISAMCFLKGHCPLLSMSQIYEKVLFVLFCSLLSSLTYFNAFYFIFYLILLNSFFFPFYFGFLRS